MLTQIPPQTLRELFATAKSFYHAKPWETLADVDTFGIVNPASGQKCYASVMGQGGNFYGLALYLGKTGYKSLLMLQIEEEGEQAGDPEEALYEQNCIMASFEAPDEMDPEDKALIEALSIDVSGMDRWPAFRSYRPGQMPWVIDEAEAKLMIEALPLVPKAVREVMKAYEDGDNFLVPGEDHTGKMRFFEQGEVGEWETKWLEPDTTVSFSPMQFQVSPEVLKEAKAIPLSDDFWLIEQFFLREPVMDESMDRPYFPKAFVMLDLQTQVLRGLDAVHPLRIEEEGAGTLVKMFAAHEVIPRQLVVSNKHNYSLLRPLTKALDIELHLDEEFDVIADIKAVLYEQMEG